MGWLKGTTEGGGARLGEDIEREGAREYVAGEAGGALQLHRCNDRSSGSQRSMLEDARL